MGEPQSLRGYRIVTLALNVPGPVAAAGLQQMGALMLKVEPPAGDPLEGVSPAWYQVLIHGQEVVRLNLKEHTDRVRLEEELAGADLLLTAQRPQALQRLGLGWDELRRSYPRLCQVAIVGYPPPREDLPGHDLTYVAEHGLLTPPELPRTLLADLVGAERIVSAALALLLARERGQGAGLARVALAEAAGALTAPLRYGLTEPGGVLGGGLPGYNIYVAARGWVALAALEPHFWLRLEQELGLKNPGREELALVFRSRTAAEWEVWAAERGLPLVAVQ